MSTVSKRVALGAAFLDENDPGWWRADAERAIDLRELDLESSDSCVLGQRCPASTLFTAPDWAHTRFDAMALSFGPFCDRTEVNEWAAPLGFQASVTYGEDPDDESGEYNEFDDFENLTAEWKRLIEERRSA